MLTVIVKIDQVVLLKGVDSPQTAHFDNVCKLLSGHITADKLVTWVYSTCTVAGDETFTAWCR
jgi:hypothetical protein